MFRIALFIIAFSPVLGIGAELFFGAVRPWGAVDSLAGLFLVLVSGLMTVIGVSLVARVLATPSRDAMVKLSFFMVWIIILVFASWHISFISRDIGANGGVILFAIAPVAGAIALSMHLVYRNIPGSMLDSSWRPLAWTVLAAGASIVIIPVMATIFADFFPEKDWLRDVPGFGNLRKTGALGAISVIAGTAIMISSISRPYRVVAAALVAIAFATLLWGGSRAGLLAIPPAALVLFVIARPAFSALLVPLAAIVLGGFMSVAMPVPGKDFGAIDRMTSLTSRAISRSDVAALGSGRVELWTFGVEKIIERPFTGHGFLQLRGQFSSEVSVYHLHSLPLELAFGFGIPAALLIMGVLAWPFLFLIPTAIKKRSLPLAGVLSMAASLAAASLVDGVLHYPFYLVMMAVLWAIAFNKMQARRSAPADISVIDDSRDIVSENSDPPVTATEIRSLQEGQA